MNTNSTESRLQKLILTCESKIHQTSINAYTKYSTLETQWIDAETGEFTLEPRKGTYKVIETLKDYNKITNHVFITNIKIYRKNEAEQQNLFGENNGA